MPDALTTPAPPAAGPTAATPAQEVVHAEPEQWLARARDHEARVDALTAGHRERASSGTPHPVEDFLFTYYRYRPGQLRRWHPGAGVVLLGDEAAERAGWSGYLAWRGDVDGRPRTGAVVDVPAVGRRRAQLERARAVVAATRGRAPQLGCFGLHEWAMVHGSAADPGVLRHERWPLRLGAEGTDAVVEDGARRGALRCTHIDAFRFYAATAAPLNALTPTRDTQVDLEQPGCLHAGMDLYRVAALLSPAASSDLVVDAFGLAREIRELDMRASPYDLRALGRGPVRVETPAGRAEYAAAQRVFAERGQALRDRLLAVLDVALAPAPVAARA